MEVLSNPPLFSGLLFGDLFCLFMSGFSVVGHAVPSKQESLLMLGRLYGRRLRTVSKFQKTLQLDVTGRLDKKTREKIAEVYNEAMAKPAEAIRKGFALANATSDSRFRAVVIPTLACVTGRKESELGGANFTRNVKKFQGVIAEMRGDSPDEVIKAQDGQVGADTFDRLHAISGYCRKSPRIVSREPFIPVGKEAVAVAKSYVDKRMADDGDIGLLLYDLDPKKPKNPEGVKALQGLLKTLGYTKLMTPGVFDPGMGGFIKGIQFQLVKAGRLTEYTRLNDRFVQLPQPYSRKGCGNECGAAPGRVGGDTFTALIDMAESKLRG